MKENKIKRKKWGIKLLNRNMEQDMRRSGAGGQKHRGYSGIKKRKARETGQRDKERAKECLSWADGEVYSHLSCCSVRMLTLTSGAELQHRTRSQLASNRAAQSWDSKKLRSTTNTQRREPQQLTKDANVPETAAGCYTFLSSSLSESSGTVNWTRHRLGRSSSGPTTPSRSPHQVAEAPHPNTQIKMEQPHPLLGFNIHTETI